MSVTCRLAVLQSKPLVYQDQEGRIFPVSDLDLKTELKGLKDFLGQAGRAIELRVETATAENLMMLIGLGFPALHFSGHGSPDELCFEGESGTTHFMEADVLRKIINPGGTSQLRMAFVSACHSREAGEAFIQAGVPHVIAVRIDDSINDRAAAVFARHFYLRLVAGEGIGSAFEAGKAAVISMPDIVEAIEEAEKFLLLPEAEDHDEVLFEGVQEGELEDRTPPLPTFCAQFAPEHLIGRNEDLHEVISLLEHGRLVTVRGAPGIGKTALALSTAAYLRERRKFPHGYFFVDLRKALSTDSFRMNISQQLGRDFEDDAELFSYLREKDALIILDNAEDLLASSGQAFRSFIDMVLLETRDLKLLVTSRHTLGCVFQNASENLYHLRSLSRQDAARLFLLRAPRQLQSDEVQSGDCDDALEVISRHPVMEYLHGHPQAIALGAALLEERTMEQVREILAEQRVDALQLQGIPDDEQDAIRSLVVSLNASVESLRTKSKTESLRLFGLMGLLPGGVMPADLDKIWGRGWRTLMETLVRASLVERFVDGEFEHFSCYPFITDYAKSRMIMAEDMTSFCIEIASHLAGMIEYIYYSLGNQVESAAARWLFYFYVNNFVECMEPRPFKKYDLWDDAVSDIGKISSYLMQILGYQKTTTEARSLLPRAIKTCRHVGDEGAEARTLWGFGLLLKNTAKDKNDLVEAESCYMQALSKFRNKGDAQGEANTLKAIGDLWGLMATCDADYEYAESLLNHARAIFSSESNSLGEANALLSLANLKRRDDWENRFLSEIGKLYEEALGKYIEAEVNQNLGEANCMRELGYIRAVQGNMDEATNLIIGAIIKHKDVGDIMGIGADLSVMGRVLNRQGNWKQSIVVCEMGKEFLLSSTNIHGVCSTLEIQGTAFRQMHNVAGTISAFWAARKIQDQLGIKRESYIEQIFDDIKNGLQESQYNELLEKLETEAEEIRRDEVASTTLALGPAPLVDKLKALLSGFIH